MAVSLSAVDYTIKGIVPIIQHNGQLADPLNPASKAMKSITSKRKKTDEDFQALYDAEWMGSLYLNEENRVVIPGQNIEAMMVEGAKKQRLGEQSKAAIICDGSWVLAHEGPKDLGKLSADTRFRDIRKVRIQANSVMRCRPIFPAWSLKFTLHFLPDLLNKSQVDEILETCGRIVGLCDFTPKYGRFEVV